MTIVRRLVGRQFNGYLAKRLPDELDDVVDSVVDAYRTGSQSIRKSLLDDVSLRAAGVLSAYGQRMASVAVRHQSYEPLHRGLIGMGMADAVLEALDDSHSNLIVLAAVNHATSVLGRDLDAYLDDVAPLLPGAALERFRAFAARTPRDKSLAAMNLRAVDSGEEFRYV